MEDILNTFKNSHINYQLDMLKKLIEYTRKKKLIWGLDFTWSTHSEIQFTLFAAINDETDICSKYIETYNGIESFVKNKNDMLPQNEYETFKLVHDMKQNVLKIADNNFFIDILFTISSECVVDRLTKINNDFNPYHIEKYWLDTAIDSANPSYSGVQFIANPVLHHKITHKEQQNFFFFIFIK